MTVFINYWAYLGLIMRRETFFALLGAARTVLKGNHNPDRSRAARYSLMVAISESIGKDRISSHQNQNGQNYVSLFGQFNFL